MRRCCGAPWRTEGVEDDIAFTDPDRAPGLYLIETGCGQQAPVPQWRSNSAARQWMQRLHAGGGDPLARADLVYLSGIAGNPAGRSTEQALLLLKWLHGQVSVVAFDPNVRPALWPDRRAPAP